MQRWEDLDWLTPNSKFFNIAHYNRPHIDEQDWSLEITGLVRKPGRFRLSDIRARPRHELTFTLECSGNNGRPSLMTGIGTARWAGTSLAELLESGIEVVFAGADTGEEQVRDIKEPTGFGPARLADADHDARRTRVAVAEGGLHRAAVTHNVEEALLLAGRVIVLSERPAYVKAEIVNARPYPRHRGDPHLAELRHEVFSHLGLEGSW